jgi:uncharacterized RDD family membrane protein YckC
MQERIGFGKRFGALIIDGLVGTVGVVIAAFFLGGVLGGLLGGLTGSEGGAAVGGALGAMAGFTITAAIGFVIYGLIEPFYAASLGKMTLGISIGNADGTTADLSRQLLRYAIKNIVFVCATLAAITAVEAFDWIGGVLGFVVFIGCFFALGKSRQALHDMIAKTAVYPKARLT